VAVKANILIDQGTDYSTTIYVSDDNDVAIDITGYSFAAKARKHYTSNTAYSFTLTITDAEEGEVTMSMNAVSTANIAGGRYVYDCEMTDTSNVVTRLVEGLLTIKPQVTR
jgi:hypothetical protein